MKFRTEIFVPPSDFKLSYACKIAMQGSCFAENMASKFLNAGFSIDLNPFGIAYNPLSLSRNLNRLSDNMPYVSDELFEDNGIYHSFSHHSRFSGTDSNEVLAEINSRMEQASVFLRTARLLIVTFGTAFVYRLQSNGNVVSNCHKLPAKLFSYKRLTIEEIVREWDELIIRLQTLYPSLRILFTVSPIRHWKDGAHENQLSKSVLLLSVEELLRKHSHCSYFPAYEILLDDLRDYRFYTEDMLHPSSQAIDYVWEKFTEAWFDGETLKKARDFEKIHQALNHVPFHPESEAYRQFREKAETRLRELK
ncbi:MAG: GSCFA domain-containing protein [Candidatus Azobacteroides sp.]|nr:GSCFA domain-containing protein [Candidatus Azobacteroides sp.]